MKNNRNTRDPNSFAIAVVVLAVFTPLVPVIADEAIAPFEKLPPAQTCVGYQTNKKMFFFASVDVVGVNCQVEVGLQLAGTRQSLTVTIPVSSFDSGTGKRDQEVARILGGSALKPLVFRTDFSVDWPKNTSVEGGPWKVSGTLQIQERSYPVELRVEREEGDFFRFFLPTRFEALGVQVPSAGPGGLIASPREELTLFGRIAASVMRRD